MVGQFAPPIYERLAMFKKRALLKGFRLIGLLFLIAFYAFVGQKIGFSLQEMGNGLPIFFALLAEMFPPNWSIIGGILPALIETVQIAVLGTLIGGFLAIPLSFLVSHTINNNRIVYFFFKGLMNILRTIPDLFYATILVAAVGFGSFAGVLALSIYATILLVKLTAENIESLDVGLQEALLASGANKLEVIVYAIIPQVSSMFLSNLLYVFEVNIRASTILGLVGAGGIGQRLKLYLDLFRYQNASMVILIIFFFVIVLDELSTRLRARLS